MNYTEIQSPIGRIVLAGDDEGLRHIRFLNGTPPEVLEPEWRQDRAGLQAAVEQLEAYFAGELRDFDLALAPTGTVFQEHVWHALAEIPYGQTISYGRLAERIGRPGSSRAVGSANGRNPLPIVLPCHRVIGSDGSLTGYGGGLPIKRALLELEGVAVEAQKTLFASA